MVGDPRFCVSPMSPRATSLWYERARSSKMVCLAATAGVASRRVRSAGVGVSLRASPSATRLALAQEVAAQTAQDQEAVDRVVAARLPQAQHSSPLAA